MATAFGKFMPFHAKTTYAESCIKELRHEQDRIRFAVSDAAGRLQEADRQIEARAVARQDSMARLDALLNTTTRPNEEQIAAEVHRHDQLQAKLTQLHNTRANLAATLESPETAELQAPHQLASLSDRLELVRLEHERNNARDLAASLTNSEYPGRAKWQSHCADFIGRLEHKERVREEVYRRFGPDPGINESVPMVRWIDFRPSCLESILIVSHHARQSCSQTKNGMVDNFASPQMLLRLSGEH